MRKKLVLSILLIILLFLVRALDLSAQSDYNLAEQDSLALVAFYWATNGPNWTSNQEGFGFDDLSTEWKETYVGQFNKWFDGPVKDWFGVKVEKRAVANSTDSIDRVTWLWPVIGRRTDGQNLLKGYVPQEVGLLTALEQFRVNGNDGFTWELVPDELYQPTLRHFDVEACWFGGGMSDALRNCTDIRKLNTRYNNFDYMPNLDFLDEEAVRNLEGSQWFYNSRISYAYLEKIVDHFYSISSTPQEFGFEARDMFDVGDLQEIVAPVGTSVEMVCNDAGEREEFITYQWFKDGLSKFGKNKKEYSIASVAASDYGHYTVRITNEYVKSYDGNGNYGEVFTKGVNLVPEPAAPTIERGVASYSGQFIDLYFSKRMSVEAEGYEDLILSVDGTNISVVDAEVFGRLNKQVRLHLESPIMIGEEILLAYAEQGITDANGGILMPFDNLMIENRVRVSPIPLDAATTLDGSGIEIRFDNYIDGASLDGGQFEVIGNNTYEIASLSLSPGAVDPQVSKRVLLTLSEDIVDSAEVLSVRYVEGKISGLYGGSVTASDVLTVLNRVSVDKTDFRILFEDGSLSLQNLLIKGSWKVEPSNLSDDGMNGDVVAGDHIWTYQASLVDDNYTWEILSRESVRGTDTIRVTDPTTGITTLTLIPTEINVDSVLSANINLNFSVVDDVIEGDTIFGIQNRDVIFNVKVAENNDDVFLMGIQDDWAIGQSMSLKGTDVYSDTLPRMTAGDILQYNYRIGSDWENLTPEPRSYVVKNGINIINDDFGVFTAIDNAIIPTAKIYPNPSFSGHLRIEGLEDYQGLKIYNSLGQLVQFFTPTANEIIEIDLSRQPKGTYFLVATSPKRQVYTHLILLQ